MKEEREAIAASISPDSYPQKRFALLLHAPLPALEKAARSVTIKPAHVHLPKALNIAIAFLSYLF
ncbi:MAG: hypothetical protein A3I66_20950 [Burkholderiales bacterium RIFCSPLOWO2_02_FULL_57_36]|nr:MAG: hypothetical protein A3I66_20950 [Burkholderiales bacterium RIFCSPLOWO2_02_FULL_57_36]